MGLLSVLGRLGRRTQPDAMTAGQRNMMEALMRPGQREAMGLSSRRIESQLNNIEDMIVRLPPHEQPVADLILREQGANAAARWIRQTMRGA